MSNMVALVAAPIIVWAGVFAYMMHLESKLRKLKR
ncbi:MAG: CcmD family protein [Armatimonadota bacterium]|nr:CcmD family protein [bacterium]